MNERRKLARSFVPSALLHRPLPLRSQFRSVTDQRVFDLANELLQSAKDPHSRSVSIFIERRDDYRLSCRQILAYLDGAAVTGEGVVLTPGQHAHVEVLNISG